MTGSFPQIVDLSFLRDRKVQRRIALTTGLFTLAGLGWFLVSPRWYRSEMTVVPSTASKATGISSLIGGDLGGIAASLGAPVGGAVDVARIAAVLQSTAVTDAVIQKLDLKARYGESTMEQAREALWSHCDVKLLPKPAMVQAGCEDKDPAFAQQLLSAVADFGNQVFRRVNVSSATEEVRYLERRAAELTASADEAARRMREFQEKNGIVDIETQAKAVVSSAAALHGQRLVKQMELDYARNFSTPDEPGARQLESQLSVMDETLRDLEQPRPEGAGGKRAAAGKGMFPAALSVPRLRAEYEKLWRDRKVAEATLVLSLDRLESARASEARDVSTFQVLDPPTLPTRKARPRGSVALVGAAALGFTIAMLVELWRARKRSAAAG